MLVVTRRKGQRIVIGNDIEVVVSGISGSTVRLAIVAPRSVTVLRGEVYETVLEQNRAAAATALGDDVDALLALTEGVPVDVEPLALGDSKAEPPSGEEKPRSKRTIVTVASARTAAASAEREED